MKTAKQHNAGLVGEGEFIPKVDEPDELSEACRKSLNFADLARLKAERDELREALDAIMQSDRSTPFICDALRRQARAILKRTEAK